MCLDARLVVPCATVKKAVMSYCTQADLTAVKGQRQYKEGLEEEEEKREEKEE